jgi:hypothetical protein
MKIHEKQYSPLNLQAKERHLDSVRNSFETLRSSYEQMRANGNAFLVRDRQDDKKKLNDLLETLSELSPGKYIPSEEISLYYNVENKKKEILNFSKTLD